MFSRFAFGLLLLLVGACNVSPAAAAESLSADRSAQVDQLMTKLRTEQQIPAVSVAIGAGNQLVVAKACGEADVENGVPATTDTVFRTASIAKTFTAVAAMQLAERGKLALDLPVSESFADLADDTWAFTPRQLLGHVAGIRHYRNSQEAIGTRHFADVSSALKLFADNCIEHEPGSHYCYTTFGYNLLGALVEHQADEPFADYLDRAILQPAGMGSTQVDHHFAIIPHRARGYIRWSKSKRPNVPRAARRGLQEGELYNASLHDTSMKVPGGGMVSTPSDLVRFASALARGDLLQHESLEAMGSEQQTSSGEGTNYGLGFRIFNHRGHKVLGHSGGQAGVATYFMFVPELGASAAVMCNLERASLKGACLRLLEIAEPALAAPALTALQQPENQQQEPQEQELDIQPVVEKLTRFIEAERKAKDLPAISVSLVSGGEIAWNQGWGFVDAGQRHRANGDTVYRAGSVSKLLTDMLAVELAHQGKLDLDADVRTYLPDFSPGNPYPDTPITLRQLMSHQSGLVREPPVGNYFDPTEPTLAETVESLNQTRLVYKPGTRTKYSNAAVSVVGRVIEEVTGHPFAEYAQQQLLEPLGMQRSSFVKGSSIEPHLALAWMRTPHKPRFEAPDFALGTSPAGNLYSTATDLAQFMSMVLDRGKYGGQQVVAEQVIDQMLKVTPADENGSVNFGLGFRIGERNGHRTCGHGGAVYGYSTQVLALPDDDLAVVALSALDGSNGVTTRICNYAIDLILAHRAGQPLPDIETSQPLPDGLAASLHGKYTHGDDQLELTEYEGKLFMRKGYQRRQLRRIAGSAEPGALVVDDVEGFGPEIKIADDGSLVIDEQKWHRAPDAAPAACPAHLTDYVGEYGWDHNKLYLYEDRGQLWALIEWFYYYPLTQLEKDVFAFPEDGGLYHGERLYFGRDDQGVVSSVEAASVDFERLPVGLPESGVFRIEPLHPVDVLRRDARAATPPAEPGDFREPDLVELRDVEPDIKYDIRYATNRNFMGVPFYQSAHAFLQRPAAEAVAQVHRKLEQDGFGLLVYDAYRPWTVTKMFYLGTPEHLRHFVANPDDGSRHNRGAAVDLTLFNRQTGEPVEMVAGYDEFTERSYPLYPGGTSLGRWHRDLLRYAMQQAGFTVYEFEWWHFDHHTWKQYPLGNAAFEQLAGEK